MLAGLGKHIPYLLSCLIVATTSVVGYLLVACWLWDNTCPGKHHERYPVIEILAIASAGLAWLQVLSYCVCIDCLGRRDEQYGAGFTRERFLTAPLLQSHTDERGNAVAIDINSHVEPTKSEFQSDSVENLSDPVKRWESSSGFPDPEPREAFFSVGQGFSLGAPSHWKDKYTFDKSKYALTTKTLEPPSTTTVRQAQIETLKREARLQLENSLKLAEGWRIHSEPTDASTGLRVAKLPQYNGICTLWSVQGHIPGATPEQVQDIVSTNCLESKVKWDTACRDCRVVDLCEEAELDEVMPTYWYITYTAQAAYLGGLVTARDFTTLNVLWMEPTVGSDGLQLSKHFLATRNTTHPSCPVNSDKVRGMIQLSCLQVEPSPLVSGTLMTFLLGIDIKISSTLKGPVEKGILKEASELFKKVERISKEAS